MTEEERKLLNNFEARIRHLIYLHDELKKECDELRQQLNQKNEIIDKLKSDYDNLEKAYSDLRSAETISLDGGDINETRKRLSKLVREVDKCIAMLSHNNSNV